MINLVVDTNILFSALIKNGISREILIDCPFSLYTPENMLSEMEKHKDLILQKSGLSNEEFDILFKIIAEKINVIKQEKYFSHIEEANSLIGHIDKDDIPFIALALSFKNEGIWSDDNHLTKQNKIRIFKTEEMAELYQGLGKK